MHIAICGSVTSICSAVGLSALRNLITWSFCAWRTLATELFCLVEKKKTCPWLLLTGLGYRTTDVQSGPIALELWLYNNPVFTYAAEAVKTANRFLNGRQLKHPHRAHAPSPRQEGRQVKSALRLHSSSELCWQENCVCHSSNKMGPTFRATGFSLPHCSPQCELACTGSWEKNHTQLLWSSSLERFQFTHHEIVEQYCK